MLANYGTYFCYNLPSWNWRVHKNIRFRKFSEPLVLNSEKVIICYQMRKLLANIHSIALYIWDYFLVVVVNILGL